MHLSEIEFSTEQSERDMIGTPVKTVSRNIDQSNWTISGIQAKRYNLTGEVISYSNSHGLCFQVRHSDGTTAWYDPEELEINQVD